MKEPPAVTSGNFAASEKPNTDDNPVPVAPVQNQALSFEMRWGEFLLKLIAQGWIGTLLTGVLLSGLLVSAVWHLSTSSASTPNTNQVQQQR